MSDTTRRLPPRPSLEQLRKQAKDLLKEHQAGSSIAEARLRAASPSLPDNLSKDEVTLSDAQFTLAREYGFKNWAELLHHVEKVQTAGRLAQYEQLAMNFVAAYNGDQEALRQLEQILPGPGSLERLREMVDRRLGRTEESDLRLSLEEARTLIARHQGFGSWEALVDMLSQSPARVDSNSIGLSSTPPFFKIDWKNLTIEPRLMLSKRDWDELFDVMKEHRLTGLNANGQMTAESMADLAKLDHVTRVSFGGTKRVTDKGLLYLAQMPQLQELDLSDYPGGWISDRGLECLKSLPELRSFQMCWESGVTDAGISNLRFCEKLENVDLLGSPTGDGAIKALVGKPALRRFKTGRLVTDAGLPFLNEFPLFKTRQSGDVKYSLMLFEAERNHLLLDGPITNRGLSSIVGLDGLLGLSFFWHLTQLTSDGLEPLTKLANLGYLGCQGELCDDVAMKHIAAIPNLRMLMGQGTIATHNGFHALSSSKTIEYIWGRECPNLDSRGFIALSNMAQLKGLGVSCKQVDDSGLSALPRLSSLVELMPMDVLDDGFRHVGRCRSLESLWCMYCRESGDRATEQITGLSKLKSYYAGLSKITDRSLEILSTMASLERIEFHECAKITNAGLEQLAGLPNLREVIVGGSPGVTREIVGIFPATVRVDYW